MPADVVLIHGFTATASAWDRVIAQLPSSVRPHPIALAGHLGGPALGGAAPTMELLTERAAAALDAAGLHAPHVVGNSLGGWVGLELASRGRAASLLGLAPAGFWRGPRDPTQRVRRRIFARQAAAARALRPLLGALYAAPPARRLALREMAVHGERVSREELLRATDGMLACEAYPELLDVTSHGASRHATLPCPVRMILCQHDRLFPPDPYVAQVRERLPQAEVTVLAGVGHVPMFDDPGLVAREIAAWVGTHRHDRD